ncbi:ATP-dependent DNA ligase [Nakamurella silvestris]|nr:ATP-dependent DNA ligase [Nakamurella silvestris]
MLFSRLAQASAEVGSTRSRLAKRRALATVIAEAATGDPAEFGLVVTYLSGSLRQRRTGVGSATLGDLPDPATDQTLTVAEVDRAFAEAAAVSGAGSVAARAAIVSDLFGRATEAEHHLLRGLVFEEIRQGALESLVQDGLAEALGLPLPTVQRAAMLLGSTADTAVLARSGGTEALQAVGLTVGRAIQPMLAAPAADAAAAVGKSGLPVVVDAKLDGIRVQVHRAGQRVRIFTRSLDEITDRLPEIVEAVLDLAVSEIILDGEVVGLDGAGRPLPFQVISSRTASRTDVDAGRLRTPLSLFAFDLLHLDGRDLLDEPLHQRARTMEQHLPAGLIVPRRRAETVEEVSEIFLDAVAQGFEGVVVKNLDAGYAAGRRDAGWIKVKPRHTFDLAVTAAEWGYGRRQGWLSNLHLAARDQTTGELVMLGKTFKGLTDVMLTWQTEQVLAREVRRDRSTVYIDPPLVAEIACDGIQRSSRYPGGIALRFARVLRYREDKSPDEIDSLATVLALNPQPPPVD